MTRSAGVLCHPTSLPNGVLDDQVWKFLDFMSESGLRVWQMLPLSEPAHGLSPYQSTSAFAMNPKLLPDNWFEKIEPTAFHTFMETPPFWLEDYALFMILKMHHEYRPWNKWPKKFRLRDKVALAEFKKNHALELQFIQKQQFALLSIWKEIKTVANATGVKLFGDMPIFVAYDSADVWCDPSQFKLDEKLNPTVVSGVPPDYFSETGQLWGNPHYNWQSMEQDGFIWWRQRVDEALKLFDWVRIDHFRGLDACWEVPADHETAMNGQWVKAPGKALLKALLQDHPELPLVAEDLGIITPEVVALKEGFELPGMSVLQFGFNGLPDNPHALNEQVQASVVYTGTHDNETTFGWWKSLEDKGHKDWIKSQLPQDFPTHFPNGYKKAPWRLVQAAFNSVADTAIIPMQDLLGLDNHARMNIPGTVENNWTWRFQWDQVQTGLAKEIDAMVVHANRKEHNA